MVVGSFHRKLENVPNKRINRKAYEVDITGTRQSGTEANESVNQTIIL